jgi:hypothetical protein
VILCLAATFALPALASAAGPRVWLATDGSWATYSMSDVNNEVRAINAALDSTGLVMDEVKHGFGFGFALGLDTPGGLSVGFGYERLAASTEIGDFSGVIRYNLPANTYRAIAKYRFPSQQPVAAAIGVGVGRVSEAGSVEAAAIGFGAIAADLKGSGPLIEGFVSGEWSGGPRVALVGSAGYRYAKVSELQTQGQTVLNPDGSKYTVDYSGLLIRIGMKLMLSP